MDLSDDEIEMVPHSVSEYYFMDENDEPISFLGLPVQWCDGERIDGNKKQVFIRGVIDNGLGRIYKQVVVWKFDLSEATPRILVLASKEKQWMKLLKPRKSYEDIIRGILITLHSLHFLRRYQETSGRALWDHLSKVLRYEPRPSENDLVDHMNFISEAVKKDEVLSKSKFLVTFLEEKPKKRKVEDVKITDKSGFIVDNDVSDENNEEGSDDDEEQGDKVCAICDNGGDILCCEGKCLRSFHATIEAGFESSCESLGFSNEQVEAIQNYYCKNCEFKRHQCFVCGELGSSDETASTVEVFRCVSGECGRFYHPHCVSKLLQSDSNSQAEELEKKINNGATFTCPFHKCRVCKQTETEKDPDLRFAMCRRCPKSYHRKCLPTEICFDDMDDEDIIPRAWEKLMPKKRILIYCLDHEIDDELLTPIRDHIKFPGEEKKKQASELEPRKQTSLLKKKFVASEDTYRMESHVKPPIVRDKSSTSTKRGDIPRKSDNDVIGRDSLKKQKLIGTSRKPLSKTSTKNKSTPDENKTSLGDMLYEIYSKGSGSVKTKKNDSTDGEDEKSYAVKSIASETINLPSLDAVSEKRVLALVNDATSSVSLPKIYEKHKLPITHAYSSKHSVDKTITLGKVEGSVEALRAAVQKLEEGCTIEDAKAVCGPGLLSEMMKWKSKLRVYLAPFLHGMRYTSFGRHFTKTDKLTKVVDKLHWYAQDGDTIVDFCCGANDFSCLMKKKLDENGKKCSYKNYDVIQPKNDFSFEKRDWMSVQLNELPSGSRLIMGLNPPFGVKASLANMFINKALEFKPKLIVLIVPLETERLDKKNPPYDLIFEDNELLAGKSFYLPGSVDINDKQMDQWNLSPPPLSFWSRRDWTHKCKAIAQQYGHLDRLTREVSHVDDNQRDLLLPVSLVNNRLNLDTSKLLDNQSLRKREPVKLEENTATVTERYKEVLPVCSGGSERPENNVGVSERPENIDGSNIRSYGDSNKRNISTGKQRKGTSELLLEEKQKSRSVQHSKSQGVDALSFKGKILPEDQQKSKTTQPSESHGIEIETPSFKGKRRRESSEISSEGNQKKKSNLAYHSQAVDTPSRTGVLKESYQHFDGKKVAEPLHAGAGDTGAQRRGSSEILPRDNQQSKSFLPSRSQATVIPPLSGIVSENYQHVDRWVTDSYELQRRGSCEMSLEDDQESFLPSFFQSVETPSLAGVMNESYQPIDGMESDRHQFGAGYSSTQRRLSSEMSLEDNQETVLPSRSQAVATPTLAGTGNVSYQHFDGRVSESHRLGAGYTDNQIGGSRERLIERYPKSNLAPPVETLPVAGLESDRYQHSGSRVSESYQFGAAGYTGTLEGEVARRYGSIGGEPYQSSTSRNRFPESYRESIENRGYMPYMGDLPSQRSSYLDGYNPRVHTPYGNLGSVPDSSYNMSGSSMMQRYAPRLDELNYTRMNRSRPEQPRSGAYDPFASIYQGQGFPPHTYFP